MVRNKGTGIPLTVHSHNLLLIHGALFALLKKFMLDMALRAVEDTIDDL